MDAWACHLCSTSNVGSGDVVQRCKLCKVPRRIAVGENNAVLGARTSSGASSVIKDYVGQNSGSTSSESQDISRAAGIQRHRPSSGPVPNEPLKNATAKSPTAMRAAADLEDLVEDLQDSKQESERRRETHEKELTRLRTMLDKVRASRAAVIDARSSSEQAGSSPTKFASSNDERRLSSSSSSSEEINGDGGAFGYSRSGNWSDDSSEEEETTQPTQSYPNHRVASEDDEDSLSDFEISSMPRGDASESSNSSSHCSNSDDGDTLGYAEEPSATLPRASTSKHSPSNQVAHEASSSSSSSSSSASSSDYSSSSSSNDSSSATESSASASSFSAAGFSPVPLRKSTRWSQPSQQPAPMSRPPYAPRLSLRSDDDDQDADAHILAASPSAAPSFNGGYAGMDFEGGPDGAASRSFSAAVNLSTDSADEFAYVAEGIGEEEDDDEDTSPGRAVTDSLYRRYETLGTPQGDSPRYAKAQRSGLAFAKDARLRQASNHTRGAPADHRRNASNAAASPEMASPNSPFSDSSSLDSATTPMSSKYSLHQLGKAATEATKTSASATAAANAADAAEAAAIRQAHVAAAAAARRYDAVLAAETAAREAEAAAVEAEAARERVGARAAERAKTLALEHERLSAASAAADLALAVELEVEEQAHALARNYALEAQVAVDRQVAEERLYSGSAEDDGGVRDNDGDEDDDGADTSFMPPYDAQSPHNSSLDGPPPTSTPPFSPPRHTTTVNAVAPANDVPHSARPIGAAPRSTHPHVIPPPSPPVTAPVPPPPLHADQQPRAGSVASSSSGSALRRGQQPVHLASGQEASAARAAMVNRAGSQGRPETYHKNTTSRGVGNTQGRAKNRFSRDHSSHDDVRGKSESRILGELSYIDMAAAMTSGHRDKPTRATARQSLDFARKRLGVGSSSLVGGSLDAQKPSGLGVSSSSQSGYNNKVKGGIGYLASMESANSHVVGMGPRRLAGGNRFTSYSTGDVRGGSPERPPPRQPQRHISFEDTTVGGDAPGTKEGGERNNHSNNHNNEMEDTTTIEDSWAADGVGPFAPGGYRRDSDSDSDHNSPNGSVNRGQNPQQQRGLPDMIGASKTLTRRLDLSKLDSLRSASLGRAWMDASNSTTPRNGGTPLRGSRAATSATSSLARGSSSRGGVLRGGSTGRQVSGGFGGGFGRSSVKNPPSTRESASTSRSRPISPPPRSEVYVAPAPREVSYLDLIGAVEATGPRQSSSEQRPPRSRQAITTAGERSPSVARSAAGSTSAPFSPDFTSMEPSPGRAQPGSQKRQGVAARAAAAAAKHAARLKKAAFPASSTATATRNNNTSATAAVPSGAIVSGVGQGYFPTYRDRVAQQQSSSQSRSSTPARGTPTPQALGSNPHSPHRKNSGSGSVQGASTSRALNNQDYDYDDDAVEGDDVAEGDELAEEALRSALVGLFGPNSSNSSPSSGGLPPNSGSIAKAHRRNHSNKKHSLNAPVADLVASAADSYYSTMDPSRSSVSMPPQRRSISPPREPLGSYQYLLHKLKRSSKSKQSSSPSWHDAYMPPPNRKLQRPWAK